MEDEEADLLFGVAHVSMTPFSRSARRLSSSFVEPSRPVRSARRLAWVSLQGRLVNADEASSAITVKGDLAPAQAVAWELFTPIHRFLIVAVIGVAVAESNKNAHIRRLHKSVQLRDQVLSSMQQKLDSLCDQLNNVKDCSGIQNSALGHETQFDDPGSCLYDQLGGNKVMKAAGENFNLTNFAEQEERRMSDLSDWASSVTSATEIHMNNLAVEQDIYNLKRDCDDKDAIIKELTTLLQSSDLAGARRISELEDIIKRKNSTITRLKKDIIVLEQKVMNFARLQRPSFSSPKPPSIRIPVLTDNIIYNMDNTTGPSSSSDSDNSPNDRSHQITLKLPPQTFELSPARDRKPMPPKYASSDPIWGSKDKQPQSSRSVSPLKEISMNRKTETVSSSSSRLRRSSNSADTKRSSRRSNLSSHKNSASSHKRWV